MNAEDARRLRAKLEALGVTKPANAAQDAPQDEHGPAQGPAGYVSLQDV